MAEVASPVQALVAEVRKMLVILRGNELRDAGLTGSVQRLLHYEIAACGTTAAFAGQPGAARRPATTAP